MTFELRLIQDRPFPQVAICTPKVLRLVGAAYRVKLG